MMFSYSFLFILFLPDVHLYRLPEHVVDGNDVLFVDVLRVADDGGARLQPHVSSMSVHQAVVVGKHLAFIQYCNTHV